MTDQEILNLAAEHGYGWVVNGEMVPFKPDEDDGEHFLEMARALLSKAIPEGHVVVPKEPTQEMRAIGYESYRRTLNNPKWVELMFKAMIAAAPSVEGEGA